MLHHRCYESPGRPGGPHGGRTETLVRVGFAVMLGCLFMSWVVVNGEVRLPNLPEADLPAINKSNAIARTFAEKGKDWTPDDLVAVRNGLVNIMYAQDGHSERVNDHVHGLIRSTVGETLDNMAKAYTYAKNPQERVRAMFARDAVMQRLNANPPSKPLVTGGPMVLVKIALWLAKLYAWFMPFALLCFIARIAKYKMSYVDEVFFGFRRLIRSVLFWPVGMGEYPNDPAITLRRQKLTYEYMARAQISRRDHLTRHDLAVIEELVNAPKAELRAKLNAISELPWHLLIKARLAFCASVFAGFMLSVISFGRGTAHAAEVEPAEQVTVTQTATAVEPLPAPLVVHGYAQFKTDTVSGTTAPERLVLRGTAEPTSGLSVSLMGGLFGKPALYVAQANAKRGPFTLSVGQIVLRSAFAVPAPDGQRVMDGPGAQWYLPFWRLGLSVAGDHGWVNWFLALLPGRDASKPDANNPKEAQFAFTLPNLGPAHVMAAVQGGHGDGGLKLSSVVETGASLGSADVSVLAVANREAGITYGGVSSFVGWRSTLRWLDLAAIYDRLWPSTGAWEHRIRGQVTFLAYKDRLRFGIMGMWSSLTGYGSTARFQFGF